MNPHALPHPAPFYETTAGQVKHVAGHQAKFTVVLGLALKRDWHNEAKGYVWDTWMLELVNILVYHHLPKNKLSLRTAL